MRQERLAGWLAGWGWQRKYVVNIPVDDQDAVDAQVLLTGPIQSSPRRHCNVVEETEAHRAAALGVVARRPHNSEAVCNRPAAHGHRELDGGTRGE